ncbi:MAG: chloride channel protein [Eggerthellaceae bacterium]|jgi:hypothetical protein
MRDAGRVGNDSRCAAAVRWLLTGRTERSRKAPKARKAPRPLVSSAGRPLEGGWQKAGIYLGLLILSALLGLFLGALVWVTFQASFFLAQVLWEATTDVLAGVGIPYAKGVATFAICTVGGMVVGWCGLHFGGMPEPFMQVLATVRRTGVYETAGMGSSALGVLLPQVFGGAVGLAAGLIGLVAAGCTFIGSSLRLAGLKIMGLGRRNVRSVCSALVHAPVRQARRRRANRRGANRSGCVEDDVPDCNPLSYDFRPWAKWVLYSVALVAGIGAFALLTVLLGTQAVIPRFEVPHVAGSQVLWAIPCILLGWAGIAVFSASSSLCARAEFDLSGHPVLMPLVGGLVLGAVAAFLPGVQYSGIAQTPALLENWGQMGVAALMATGFCKFALVPWCIATGWKGGQIYPCVFAAAACGLGFSGLTGADPALCLAATVSTATACLLRSPAFAFVLLLICFPIECTPLLAIACIAGAALPVPQAGTAGKGVRH